MLVNKYGVSNDMLNSWGSDISVWWKDINRVGLEYWSHLEVGEYSVKEFYKRLMSKPQIFSNILWSIVWNKAIMSKVTGLV